MAPSLDKVPIVHVCKGVDGSDFSEEQVEAPKRVHRFEETGIVSKMIGVFAHINWLPVRVKTSVCTCANRMGRAFEKGFGSMFDIPLEKNVLHLSRCTLAHVL